MAQILDVILVSPRNPPGFHLLENDAMGMSGSLLSKISGAQHQVLEMAELSVLVTGISMTGQESGDEPVDEFGHGEIVICSHILAGPTVSVVMRPFLHQISSGPLPT